MHFEHSYLTVSIRTHIHTQRTSEQCCQQTARMKLGQALKKNGTQGKEEKLKVL